MRRTICLGLLLAGLACAEEEPARLLRFGDELLEGGEQYRAITEYLRFQSYFPEDARAGRMPLRIGLAYLRGGRPEQALDALRPIFLAEAVEPGVKEQAFFLQGRAYYEAGLYEQALGSWKNLGEGPEATLARRFTLFSLLRLGRTPRALEFLEADRSGLPSGQAERLREALGVARPPKRRSVGLAAGLSAVLPGGGQLYAGRPRDALVAFLVNGLFTVGAVRAFRSGNVAMGIALSSFETGWYTGNIVSAASSARRFNELARERWLAETARLPGLEEDARRAEAALILGIDF